MTRWPQILIVEDEVDQVAAMRGVLRERFPDGLFVSVNTGRQAETTDLQRFDLILLEYHLPDCTGLELVPKLVAKVSVPVIMVTGLKSCKTAASAIHTGASDYIIKTDGYLDVLPVVVEKNLVMASLRANVAELQEQLHQRYIELREKNEQLELRNRQLREAALHDPLTGLYNRRYINEAIEQLVSRSRRYNEELACMMIDLDRFKAVNDTLGHLVGDKILQLAGKVILDSIRQSDLAARFGGDEFMVLLPNTPFLRAQVCAERIAAQFRRAIETSIPKAAHMTLSVGIASVERDHCGTHQELIAAADRAMYACKAEGRGGVFPALAVPV